MHDPFKVPFKKIRTWRYIIISFLAVFFINGIVENILVQNKINSFIKNSTFVREEKRDDGILIKYYAVSRETSANDALSVIDGNTYVGKRGDILLTKVSPFDNLPVIHQFVSFFFGGHASINISETEILESVGNQEKNGVRIFSNNWFYDRTEAVGLRIKGFDDKEYDEVVNLALEKLGLPYNYTFVFNTTNAYYCTDLISSTVRDYCGKLKTFLFTTVNDLINDKDTYLFYYHYVDAEGIMHVYYLE